LRLGCSPAVTFSERRGPSVSSVGQDPAAHEAAALAVNGAARARSSRTAAAPSGVAALVVGGSVLVLIGVCAWLTFLTGDVQASFVSTSVSALVFAAVGVVVARRQPGNPIGWLLAGCGVLAFLLGVFELYAVLDYRVDRGALPLGKVAVLAEAIAFVIAVLFGLVVLLFPDGRLPARRWRPVLWAYLLSCALFMAYQFIGQSTVFAVRHLRVDLTGSPLNNPEPAGAVAGVADVGQRFSVVILACWVCFVARQVISYRHAAGERRQQLKWLMSGGAICVVAVVVSIYAGNYSSPAARAVQAAGGLAVAALPVAIGVGILKYRLYDIDRIISLVGVYAGLVLLATRVLPLTSPVAVAASTLAVAALFTPLRRRVRQAVDRRFNRARYDADQAIAAFAAQLQDAMDLDAVRADLLDVVRRCLEPANASVWLRPAQDHRPISMPLPVVGSGISRLLTDNRVARSAPRERAYTPLCKQRVRLRQLTRRQ